MTRTHTAAAFPTQHFLQAALRVSLQSAAWTVCSSTIAVALGIGSRTVVLIALGAIGFVDAVGSVTLAVHFRHALQHEAASARLERIAHAVVLLCLSLVGAAAVAVGLVRLARGDGSDASAPGLVLAAVSVVALLGLSVRKQMLATPVASEALRSDGHLSAIGAAQAVVALGGIVATRWFSWTAADAAATTLVGLAAVALAATTWLRKQ